MGLRAAGYLRGSAVERSVAMTTANQPPEEPVKLAVDPGEAESEAPPDTGGALVDDLVDESHPLAGDRTDDGPAEAGPPL
jgi:hypothetical protein